MTFLFMKSFSSFLFVGNNSIAFNLIKNFSLHLRTVVSANG